MNYAPELTGIGKFSHEMASWLNSKHETVRVICSTPYYPEWQIHSGYKNQYQKSNINGITTFRCPIFVPSKLTGKNRILHLASYALTSAIPSIRQIKWQPSLILCVSPNLISSAIPLVIGKIIRAKTWLHIQDLEVDAASKLGIIKNKWLLRVLYKLEYYLYSHFDRITTISVGMQQQLLNKGVNKEKVGLMPNWANLDDIRPLDKDHPPLIAYRKELNIPTGTKIVLYSGTISEKQGIENVIHAAQYLLQYDILLLICSNSPSAETFKKLSAGLKNIKYINLVPTDKFNLLLNLADIHLMPQSDDIDNAVMPSKLSNMIAVGGPILVCANETTHLSKFIVESGLGLSVTADNPTSIANAIQFILNNPSKKMEISKNCLAYSKKNLCINQILETNFYS